jgi:thymidylate kinase
MRGYHILELLKGASDIRYCVLHGWQSADGSFGSDLDIAVNAEDLSILERMLRKYEKGRIVQLLQHEASGHYFVLAVRGGGRVGFVEIDAACDYRRDGCVFLGSDQLLDGRRRWNELWVAAPDVEFRYLLTKKVLKGRVPERHRKRLGKLVEELGSEARSIAYRQFGQRRGEAVISWVSGGTWNGFEANMSCFKRALLWQIVRRDPLNPVRYWMPELRRRWNRWWHPTGLFVAVLGPDGAGKSTLVQHLQENLGGAFRQTQVLHLRPGIMGRKRTSGPVTNPHGRPPHPLWFSLFKLPYYFLDYSLGYLLKVRPRLARSTLVLFDRYYDDLLVDPRRYRYGGPMGFARLVGKFIPKPDLLLILDLHQERLLARKREISPEESKRQQEGYRRLATEVPNAVLLDGSLDASEVARCASEAILDYLHQRYLERRHLWFRDDDSETFNWLASVLSPAKKMRFVLSNRARVGPESQWKSNGSFGWLPLKDGRGYLVPLRLRQSSLSALRLYNAQNLKARIVKKLLTMGFKGGCAHHVLQKVQTLIHHDVAEAERGKISLLDYLKEVLRREDLVFALSLGTPGPHRKPVIQVLTDEGEVLGYAKVGWNEATSALVEHEASVLQRMARTVLSSFTIPRVLHSGWWNGRFLLIQSAPEDEIQPAPRDMTPKYLSVLKELASLHTRSVRLRESAFWINLIDRIEKAPRSYYRHVLRQGASGVENSLRDARLLFHFRHGDFVPWNAKVTNGRLFVFDWEYADLETPPGWDLFHFVVQTLWHLKKRAPDEIYNEFFDTGMNNPLIRMYLEFFNLKEHTLRSLFLLYLLDRLALFSSEEDVSFHKVQPLATAVNLCLCGEKL